MIKAAYYNENDPYAAQWLKNLIARGLIAPGDVDDRSITLESAPFIYAARSRQAASINFSGSVRVSP